MKMYTLKYVSELMTPSSARSNFFWGLIATFLLMFSQASRAEIMALNAVITQSPCVISFTDGSGASITTLPLGNINSADIAASGPTVGIYQSGTLFNIKLSACGAGGANVSPTVSVTGMNAVASELTSKASNEFKFRNAGQDGGTSKEYFVVFGQRKNMIFQSVVNNPNGLFGTLSGHEIIWKGSKAASGDGTTIPLYASVGCYDVCGDNTKVVAGTLNASLRFQFEYK